VLTQCVLHSRLRRNKRAETKVRRPKFRNGIGGRKPMPVVNDRRLVWCASTKAVLGSMLRAVSMVDRVGR
jgi:hypothetical protein